MVEQPTVHIGLLFQLPLAAIALLATLSLLRGMHELGRCLDAARLALQPTIDDFVNTRRTMHAPPQRMRAFPLA